MLILTIQILAETDFEQTFFSRQFWKWNRKKLSADAQKQYRTPDWVTWCCSAVRMQRQMEENKNWWMTADIINQGTSLSDGAGGLEGGGLTNKYIFK